jgi:hypothetical protein
MRIPPTERESGDELPHSSLGMQRFIAALDDSIHE